MAVSENNRYPLISVIVPVYMVEPYLDRCITSIVRQSFRDIEVILVDDGTLDNCGKMCDDWAKKDRRIRVFHQKNYGLSAARNTGINHAQGKYLCFVDSDDYIETDMLEKLLAALLEQQADIAVCNFVYEYERAEQIYRKNPESYQNDIDQTITGREIMLMAEQGKHSYCVVAWNKLYKRSLFEKLRYPEGKIHEDEFVFHHIMSACQRVICLRYTGYHYVQREGSIMHRNDSMQDAAEAFLERCRFFLERDDRQMALLSEGEALSAVKRMQKHTCRRERRQIQKEYWQIVKILSGRKDISFYTLLKRFIWCRIF